VVRAWSWSAIRCKRPPVALALALALAAACGGRGRSGSAPDAAPAASAPAPDAAPAVSAATAPLWLERVSVSSGRSGDAALDARLAEVVRGALTGDGAFLPAAQPGAVGARVELQVEVGAVGEPGKERMIEARAQLRVRWKDGDVGRSMEARVAGQRKVTPAERPRLRELAEATLDRAVADAAALVVARERIRRGDEAAVLAALDHADPDVRDEAYRAVGARGLRAAIPRLVQLLGHEDAEVRDAAIGALVELRAEEAVKPLVDMVEFSDVDMMRRIIDAVGMIGGEEATAYLEFVASGHEQPAVRELARQALEHMQRRGDAGPR
jgi:hypothetical protein